MTDSKLIFVSQEKAEIVFENTADYALATQHPLFVFENEDHSKHSCVLVITDLKQQKDCLYYFLIEEFEVTLLMTFESRIAKIWQTKEGLRILDTNSNLSLVKLMPDTEGIAEFKQEQSLK